MKKLTGLLIVISLVMGVFLSSCTMGDTLVAPAFSPEPGTFTEATLVSLGSPTDGATIYYTLDGSDPDITSDVYTESIMVMETTEIRAIVELGGAISNISAGNIVIVPAPADPSMSGTINLSGGAVIGDIKVGVFHRDNNRAGIPNAYGDITSDVDDGEPNGRIYLMDLALDADGITAIDGPLVGNVDAIRPLTYGVVSTIDDTYYINLPALAPADGQLQVVAWVDTNNDNLLDLKYEGLAANGDADSLGKVFSFFGDVEFNRLPVKLYDYPQSGAVAGDAYIDTIEGDGAIEVYKFKYYKVGATGTNEDRDFLNADNTGFDFDITANVDTN